MLGNGLAMGEFGGGGEVWRFRIFSYVHIFPRQTNSTDIGRDDSPPASLSLLDMTCGSSARARMRSIFALSLSCETTILIKILLVIEYVFRFDNLLASTCLTIAPHREAMIGTIHDSIHDSFLNALGCLPYCTNPTLQLASLTDYRIARRVVVSTCVRL